jgi:hypothetical protein
MAVLPTSLPLSVPCPIEGCDTQMVTTAVVRYLTDPERGGLALTTLAHIDPAPFYAHADTHLEEAAHD